MVPMLTCGLVRSNFAFATGVLLKDFLVRRAPDAQAAWFSRLCGASGRWPQDRCVHVRSSLGLTRSARSPPSLGLIARQDGFARWRSLPRRLRDDFLGHVRGNLRVRVELHAVA